MRTIPITALLLLLAASHAFAGAPGTVAIAVDTTTLSTKVADEVQDGIAVEVMNGLAEVFSNLVKAKVELVPVSEAKVVTQVRECEGAECLQDLAKSAKVDLVVQVKVQAKKATKKAKADYAITMVVARAVPDRDAWREKTDCQACTGGDVKHMASLLASTIAERINIEVAQPAPQPTPIPPVAATPPAPRPTDLVTSPAATKPEFYVPRALSIAALVGGVALVGSGIYLLHLNGQGTCNLAASQKQCPSLYDTTGVGTGLVIGGGAAVVGGLVGLIFFPPRAGASQVALGFNGSSISVRGAF